METDVSAQTYTWIMQHDENYGWQLFTRQELWNDFAVFAGSLDAHANTSSKVHDSVSNL